LNDGYAGRSGRVHRAIYRASRSVIIGQRTAAKKCWPPAAQGPSWPGGVSGSRQRARRLTDKNLAVVRKVLTPGVWKSVVSLPADLMREARANLPDAPIKAALAAQIAVGISILSFAPIRLGNLVAIKIEENLIKPGGPNSAFWLVFPHYDVKNRVGLELTFDETVTKLIDEYIHHFRPHLLRGPSSSRYRHNEGRPAVCAGAVLQF